MEMSNSLIPQLLHLQGKSPQYKLNKRTRRLQKRSGHFGREKNHMLLLALNPGPFSPYLDTTLTILSWLPLLFLTDTTNKTAS